MIHRDNGSEIARAIHEPAGAANPRLGLSWILASFGFLVAGLVGGTIMFVWKPDWVFPFPAVGFIGYLLAFRRGMLLWSPNIDMTWWQYLWLERDTASEDGRPAYGTDDPSGVAEGFRVLRPEPPRPSPRELRAVR
jgi:hypothetical protein